MNIATYPKGSRVVLQGNEADIEWALSIGAKGVVPVCANYEPRTFVNACQANINGDKTTVSACQKRIDYLRNNLLVKSENWIAGIMYGVSSLGIGNGKTLMPLLEISAESRKRINTIKPADPLV